MYFKKCRARHVALTCSPSFVGSVGGRIGVQGWSEQKWRYYLKKIMKLKKG
jgi:3-methyladenine DNA glycosylase Mpg